MCDRCRLKAAVDIPTVDRIQHAVVEEFVVAGGRDVDVHTVLGIAQAAFMSFLALQQSGDIDKISQENLDKAGDSQDVQVRFLKLLALYFSMTETIPGSTVVRKIKQPS